MYRCYRQIAKFSSTGSYIRREMLSQLWLTDMKEVPLLKYHAVKSFSIYAFNIFTNIVVFRILADTYGSENTIEKIPSEY